MWKTENEKLKTGPVDTMFRDNGPNHTRLNELSCDNGPNGGLVRVFP